jgi:hypothetical protein
MAKEYDKTNKGAIWLRNVEAAYDDSRKPVFSGTLNVDGVDYKIAGWLSKALSDPEYAEVLNILKDGLGNLPLLNISIQPADAPKPSIPTESRAAKPRASFKLKQQDTTTEF